MHSKPTYPIASCFVKPMRFLPAQSENLQRRSISINKMWRGNENRFTFFIRRFCQATMKMLPSKTANSLDDRTESHQSSGSFPSIRDPRCRGPELGPELRAPAAAGCGEIFHPRSCFTSRWGMSGCSCDLGRSGSIAQSTVIG